VAAGRGLLEAGGLDAVTMQAVAAIGTAALEDLGRQLEPPGRDSDPASGLRSIATAFRAFAHENPRAYELLFMNLPPESRPLADRFALASAPLLAVASRLVGPDHALEAARLVTAFAHGFVSMELGGAFRLGGDVDEAYRYGVDVLVSASPPGSPHSQFTGQLLSTSESILRSASWRPEGAVAMQRPSDPTFRRRPAARHRCGPACDRDPTRSSPTHACWPAGSTRKGWACAPSPTATISSATCAAGCTISSGAGRSMSGGLPGTRRP
jgi:hypothetical protein